ncbi:hypothetical protein H5410_021575 [Solanum commersonii]|uniref:Uncharacterized protein n=1 Tax=Solanum commersonii TaxID=4109 RepID=A0A9J5ZHL5_SOLCO|nr:hypothetical protein H5410_021575 [Solanum commersonii]
MSTGFYEKRNDIDWKNSEEYADYAFTDPLAYMVRDDIKQQLEGTNFFVVIVDIHLFNAENFCQGNNDITLTYFESTLFRTGYAAFLWNYATQKFG